MKTAQTVKSLEVLDTTLKLPVPKGYCALKGHAADAEFLDRARAMSASQSKKLLQFAVPCNDRNRFRAGQLEFFPRYSVVSLVGRNGASEPDPRPREQVLADLGKGPSDPAALPARLSSKLSTSSTSVRFTAVESLGRDGNAFYFLMLGRLDGRVNTINLGAAVPIHQLPISVSFVAPAEGFDAASGMAGVTSFAAELVAANHR